MIKYSLLFLILFFGQLYATDSLLVDTDAEFDDFLVHKIEIKGNTHTKDIVITREMNLQVGAVYDDELLDEDLKRIRNLNLFSRVEMVPEFTDEGVDIYIYVAEQWHIFPYPILFLNEKDWDKLSYGAGLLHDNIHGMHNTLMASFWLGYNPGIDIIYSNPWIGGDKHYYYNFRVYSTKIKSKSFGYERFDQGHHGGSFTFGKRWGYRTYLTLSLGYRQVRLPDRYKFLTYSGTGTDHLPSLGLEFKYDKRDLWAYPKEGYYFDCYMTKTSDFGNIDYFRYGADVRQYIPLFRGLSLGLRGAADLSTGSVPSYQKIYLGYTYRIRGQYDTRREGDNRLLANVELRFPIMPVRYLDLGQGLYDMGSYTKNIPFGISGALFYDAGTVWYRGESWRDSDRLQGFGAGLHFHVPYVQLLRLETAWDRDFNQQYIIDIEVMF